MKNNLKKTILFVALFLSAESTFAQTTAFTYQGKLTAATTGTAGYLTGGQFTAIELQYIGNGQFFPVSHEGTISGF